MSTLRVTVEHLTIHEHPNADALELAQVGLYRAVVAKGTYRLRNKRTEPVTRVMLNVPSENEAIIRELRDSE